MKRVGQILSEARKNKGLSLEDVEQATKIRKKTLLLLEEGVWQALPSPIFVRGLLKNYGKFLGISAEDVLAFYRREFDEKKVVLPRRTILKNPSSFRLTPRWVTGFVALVVMSLVLGYLFVQYRSFTGTPFLEVVEPKDNTKIQGDQANVVGRTWPDAILKINGQEVQLDPGGSFSVAVSLPEGVNTITVTAANRFGKISTEKRTLVVSPKTENEPPPKTKVELKIKIGPNAVSISAEVDGKISFEGVLASGAERVFQAERRIRLISHNAGSTTTTFEGKESILGKEGETIEKSFP
ncbi:MAG: helix-turn-helix domain-containing protein [bacterium]|nr:helix-turn-helix domain-containing protein [bacterium]